jgi:hypothetical protein
MNGAGDRTFRFVAFLSTAALAFFLAATIPRSALSAPEIVNGRNFNGQSDAGNFPWATGAVGPTRYIQLVDERFAIYSRASASTTPISSGTLNALNEHPATVQNDYPQVIWDATTRRFYYVMDSRFGSGDNRLTFGYSKTASPNSPADFCHVTFGSGTDRRHAPRLGDSEDYIIVADSYFTPAGFFQALMDIFPKPPAGTDCAFSAGFIQSLADSGGNPVVSPVAANGVDDWAWGYVIARNPTLPSNKLWLFGVTRGAGGAVFGPPKELTLPFEYDAPPPAQQPGAVERIDTGDASPTQAVLARNPDRGGAFSLWTQHTVRNGAVSAVRWYEINPFPRPPVLLRSGLIASPGVFIYNGAISPDRRVNGATFSFGDSFVIQFNRSNATDGIRPQIRMGSSVGGGPLSFATVVNGAAPYSDPVCPFAENVCFWARHAACTPDPAPATTGRGVVWCTNVFAGPDSTPFNWRSRIFAVRP